MWILSGCDSALQQVLFMYEVGGWAGGGLSLLLSGPSHGRGSLAEPKTLPGEGTAEGTGFHTAKGSALLFVFDQKKKKSCRAGLRDTQPLIPKRSPWTWTLPLWELSPGRGVGTLGQCLWLAVLSLDLRLWSFSCRCSFSTFLPLPA